LIALIAEGKLGKIRYIYSNRLNIGKLRTEENILWSFAPHDISVILALVGEEPLKVGAFGESYLSKGIYDTTLTMLEFRNGIKAHIFVSWIHPFKEQKLIVVGSSAMAVFDDVSKEKLFLYPHLIRWKDGKIPVAEKANYEVVPIESAEPLRRELEHFITCVQKRQKPITDGREALRVLSILEKSEEALVQSKLEPVSSVKPHPGVFIHESSIVDGGVMIGHGTKIWHFTHILSGSRIGFSCNIGQNVMIGPDVIIGDRCKIQNNVSVYKGVTLEEGVFCSPSMVFTNIYNPRAEISKMDQVRKTLVKKGATLGANCTIVCGNTIGQYAFIGAGAVVTKDVPDHALVIGNPAERVGWVCRCGGKINEDLICLECGEAYRQVKGHLTAKKIISRHGVVKKTLSLRYGPRKKTKSL
jgi:UDP-2-acetamido-3-amino-2,3-dideoxy-glucuronate N-acetyltransferase